MIIVKIYKDGDYYWLASQNATFKAAWGDGIRAAAGIVLTNMQEINTWARQNGHEVQFEFAD